VKEALKVFKGGGLQGGNTRGKGQANLTVAKGNTKKTPRTFAREKRSEKSIKLGWGM